MKIDKEVQSESLSKNENLSKDEAKSHVIGWLLSRDFLILQLPSLLDANSVEFAT